ncbi:hypothetical protein ACEQPO_25695 [Bacillus sp. SL00103]
MSEHDPKLIFSESVVPKNSGPSMAYILMLAGLCFSKAAAVSIWGPQHLDECWLSGSFFDKSDKAKMSLQ